MPKKKYIYLGNHPNSRVYNPNIPIGINKWDLLESLPDEEEENDFDNEDEEELEDENTYD